MQDSLHAALRAWRTDDSRPLVRLLGFRPTVATSGEAVATIGRAGTTVAVLLRCPSSEATAVARAVRARDGVRQHLFLVRSEDANRLELIAFKPDGEPCRLAAGVDQLRPADLDTLREMQAEGEQGVALFLRHLRALDRRRVTRRFFEAFRAMRARVAAEWTGIPASRRRERERLALLFLCRLMFLYFLQREGRLAGRTDYFRWLRGRYARLRTSRSFYRTVLVPLFHGALNRRPAQRTGAARRLGRLPYLNGGLFERDHLEHRYRKLDLPLDITNAVFDELLDRYRFATREHAAALQDGTDGAVDPEMLGRVFEGLMDGDERGRTGTFFTPAPLVDEVVRHALAARIADRCSVPDATALEWLSRPELAPPAACEALAGIRVLDPACGSGAFLLGVLTRIASLRPSGASVSELQEIIGEALHGIDVQDDAALLCALRLWLVLAASAGKRAPRLPNLERRIRQGDALVDPLDLYGMAGHSNRAAARGSELRESVHELSSAARAFLTAEPSEKRPLARTILRLERQVAERWTDAQLRTLKHAERELLTVLDAPDLFGQRAAAEHPLHDELVRIRQHLQQARRLRAQLRRRSGLPFFSYVVHFADVMPDGFDIVVSNPPWVRAHRWPAATASVVRERYVTCASPGWEYGARAVGVGKGVGAQVDLALLFLERAIRVLAAGGIVAMLLPAKLLRSLFAAGARRLLLTEMDVLRIEDRSLDTGSSFDADAFVATVIARRKQARQLAQPRVRVVMHRAHVEKLECSLDPAELPLIPGDVDAPWLLAPDEVRPVLRRMQEAGPPIGQHPGIRIRRGVMTGANDVLLLEHVEHVLGGLARIRASGSRAADDDYTATIESHCIRPVLRGSDVRAWRAAPSCHLVWLYDQHLRLRPAPRHARRYLDRHNERLTKRPGNPAPGALFRLSASLLDSFVAWRDIAPSLQAVALPRGDSARPVPLNSVYFVSVGHDDDAAWLLAAYLNSLPVRVFARTIAERAKDGFFRFFAWTVAVTPLPQLWRRDTARELIGLSRIAHESGCATRAVSDQIDAAVGAAYGLTADDLCTLQRFDAWLSGGTG